MRLVTRSLARVREFARRLCHAIRGRMFVRGPSNMRDILVKRYLCPHKDWEEISGNEYYRMSGMFREHLPPLEQILQKHRCILFLGEPGMGLSCLAHQIRLHVSSKTGSNAVLASLKAVGRNLSVVRPGPVCAPPVENEADPARWYLLDDLDQVDPTHLPQLIAEINQLESGDPGCHIALFCRQGYAAAHFAPFDAGFSRYHLLGLTSADIQHVCDTKGIDPAGLSQELERLDVGVEGGNPAVLQTLIHLYGRHGKLPGTRASLFDAILQALTSSIGIAGGSKQECLYALGFAMELASRNFLTPAEAEVAIGARLDISPPEAVALLRKVSSFLLLTPEGIWFQHHSFGEFFAACALRDRRLSVVLDSVFFPGTRIPNPSWKSALGFLAEMHSAVRRYLASHHPELALAASVSVLTDDERAVIGSSLYARLRNRREPLAHHPDISASRLAQCLPACRLGALEDDAKQRSDPILACNALLLLGEVGLRANLPLALATALDINIDRPIRDCAFHAVGCLGTSALIPQLIARIDHADPCYVSMLISIGRLADEAAIPLVMPVLLATQTSIHSAYEGLRRLRPKPTALGLLALIGQQPGLIDDLQWRFYASCLPAAIRRGWDEEIAAAVVDALTSIEQAGVFDLQNAFMEELAEAIATSDREEAVVREVLRRLSDYRKPVMAIPHTLLRLLSPATVRWLLSQNYDERFLISLQMYSRGELYQVFEEMSPRPPAAVDPQLAAWEREHRERLVETEVSVARAHEIVREEEDFQRIYNAVIFLGEKRLPTVSQQRLAWLGVGS